MRLKRFAIRHNRFYKVAVRVRVGLELILYTLVQDRFIAVAKPLNYLTFMKRRRVIQILLLLYLLCYFMPRLI